MNPCTIATFTSIYIAACLSIRTVSSVGQVGNPKLNPSKSQGSNQPGSSATFTALTYIDIDLTKTESTDQYEYKQEGDVETYTAKPGYAIKECADGTSFKWRFDGTRYLSKVIRTKQADGTYKYQAAKYDTSHSSSQSKIRIVTQDPSNPKKMSLNDASHYNLKEEKDLLVYKFNDNGRCVKITYDGKQVWRYDYTKPENPYPSSVLFYTNENVVVLALGEGIFIYRLENGQWQITSAPRPEVVELNIMSTSTKNKWRCSKTGSVAIYTPKSWKLFSLVKAGSNEIWKSDKCGYAAKVVLGGIGSSTEFVTIHLVNGDTMCFKKPRKDKEWAPMIVPVNLEAVELNMDRVFGNEKFYVGLSGNTHRKYVPKHGFGCNIIKEGGQIAWVTADKTHYAIEVLLSLAKKDSTPTLTVYLANGDAKYFDRNSKGNFVETDEEGKPLTTQTSSGDDTYQTLAIATSHTCGEIVAPSASSPIVGADGTAA